VKIVQPNFSEIQIENLRQKRREYVRDYSWAIPSELAIEAIRKYAPIIEVGAGGGYWSYLISLDGTSVVAVDNESESFQKKWIKTENKGPECLEFYPQQSLFLCWPPYNTPMASDCLLQHKGKYLIYIGECDGGCNADAQFFNILRNEFKLIETIEIPTWPNINDKLWVYQRT